ncbi:hypothetical protein T06_11054 [Trichinella sp. T6]|nr:hypothetical protein T06_11054 [Trichinella sp. T6]
MFDVQNLGVSSSVGRELLMANFPTKNIFLQKWTLWASVDWKRFPEWNEHLPDVPGCTVLEICTKHWEA